MNKGLIVTSRLIEGLILNEPGVFIINVLRLMPEERRTVIKTVRTKERRRE